VAKNSNSKVLRLAAAKRVGVWVEGASARYSGDMGLMMEGRIQVNLQGRRFSNEHQDYSEQALSVLALGHLAGCNGGA